MKKTELIVPSEVPFHTVFLETNDMCSREPCAEVIRGQQHYTQNTSASKNMEHTCEIVLRENGSAHNDDFQIFTTYVASKLKRCTARQSMIAEKIIADVLLRANLGTLTENTCLSENSLWSWLTNSSILIIVMVNKNAREYAQIFHIFYKDGLFAQ